MRSAVGPYRMSICLDSCLFDGLNYNFIGVCCRRFEELSRQRALLAPFAALCDRLEPCVRDDDIKTFMSDVERLSGSWSSMSLRDAEQSAPLRIVIDYREQFEVNSVVVYPLMKGTKIRYFGCFFLGERRMFDDANEQDG